MSTIYKVLGQSNPSGGVLTDIYTTPYNANTVVSTIQICNQSTTGATFKLAVRPGGEAVASKHYLAYDTPVPASDSLSLTIGMTLGANDVVSISGNTSSMSFNLFGSEIR